MEVASGGRRRRRRQHSADPARRGARSYTAAARGAPAASQPALELASDWPPPAGPGASQPPPPSPRRLLIGCGSTPAPPRLLASPECCERGRRGLEGAAPQGGGASSGLLGSQRWSKLVNPLGVPRERSEAGRPLNFGRARPRLWGLKLCLDPPRNLQDSRG